jgi:DNA-binding response OmpR family regulator
VMLDAAPVCCPACGRPQEASTGPLEIEGFALRLGRAAIYVSRKELQIAKLLNEAHPGPYPAAKFPLNIRRPDAVIHRLRNIMRRHRFPAHICTVHGYGYRLELEGGQ